MRNGARHSQMMGASVSSLEACLWLWGIMGIYCIKKGWGQNKQVNTYVEGIGSDLVLLVHRDCLLTTCIGYVCALCLACISQSSHNSMVCCYFSSSRMNATNTRIMSAMMVMVLVVVWIGWGCRKYSRGVSQIIETEFPVLIQCGQEMFLHTLET